MVTILTGDCRDILKTLPDASVNCIVTSPPYWGLRDYGTAKWEGGDGGCDHREAPSGATNNKGNNDMGHVYKDACPKCGARRIDLQIGLERTPEEYVAQLVAVFGEARRVLRDDGTLWLNLGDSYNGYMANQRGTGLETDRQESRQYIESGFGLRSKDLKPKDLVGIPWRVAFALQADGWWLRSDIIWAKPNPMPESVTDRPTRSHEYIFLLSKSARYYYDAKAIAEPAIGWNGSRFDDGRNLEIHPNTGRRGANGKWSKEHKQASGRRITDNVADARARGANHDSPFGETRNKRSVWTVTTRPYKEAHFATFPPDLIRPCILAGCPQGGTVLDPFGGSGTTGMVAEEEGRNSILIELNPKYVGLAERRTAQRGLLCEQR